VQAGYTILAEEGVKALKIDGLCRRLGVTKGSFYWHFTDIAGNPPRERLSQMMTAPVGTTAQFARRGPAPRWTTSFASTWCPRATAALRPIFRPSWIRSAGWHPVVQREEAADRLQRRRHRDVFVPAHRDVFVPAHRVVRMADIYTGTAPGADTWHA
jgi:AcrR family transcriptional regulator